MEGFTSAAAGFELANILKTKPIKKLHYTTAKGAEMFFPEGVIYERKTLQLCGLQKRWIFVFRADPKSTRMNIC